MTTAPYQEPRLAFGAWWPLLRALWGDAGALLTCGGEACRWAVLGRLVDELRPWEDLVGAAPKRCLDVPGSDSVPLLSATFVLGWLAMKRRGSLVTGGLLRSGRWSTAMSLTMRRWACAASVASAWDLASSLFDGPRSEKGLAALLTVVRKLLELVVELVMSSEGSNVQMLAVI